MFKGYVRSPAAHKVSTVWLHTWGKSGTSTRGQIAGAILTQQSKQVQYQQTAITVGFHQATRQAGQICFYTTAPIWWYTWLQLNTFSFWTFRTTWTSKDQKICEPLHTDYSYDVTNPCKTQRGKLASDFMLSGADADVHNTPIQK